MSYQLNFEQFTNYDVGQPGITLPVMLSLVGYSARVDAKLDTGATDCVFARELGEQIIGLHVEGGRPFVSALRRGRLANLRRNRRKQDNAVMTSVPVARVSSLKIGVCSHQSVATKITSIRHRASRWSSSKDGERNEAVVLSPNPLTHCTALY